MTRDEAKEDGDFVLINCLSCNKRFWSYKYKLCPECLRFAIEHLVAPEELKGLLNKLDFEDDCTDKGGEE